jgi:hypothetical protein
MEFVRLLQTGKRYVIRVAIVWYTCIMEAC